MIDQVPLVPTVVVAIDVPDPFRSVIAAPTVPVPEKFIDREDSLQVSVRLDTGFITGVVLLIGHPQLVAGEIVRVIVFHLIVLLHRAEETLRV